RHLRNATLSNSCPYKTRIDDRDADARVPQIDSDAFEVSRHRRLACTVSSRLWQSTIRSQTRNRHEPSLPARNHLGRDGCDAVHRTEHVDPHHLSSVLWRQLQRVIGSPHTCIGNQNVNWTKL